MPKSAKPARKLLTARDILHQINSGRRRRLPKLVRTSLSAQLELFLEDATASKVDNAPNGGDVADLFIFAMNRVVELLKGKDMRKVANFLSLLAEKWGFDEYALEENGNKFHFAHFVRAEKHFREITGGLEIFPDLGERKERIAALKRQRNRGDERGAVREAFLDVIEDYARMTTELPGLLIEAINDLCQ